MHAAGTAPEDKFSLADVTVQDCEPNQLAAFRDLNLAWIRRYFSVEAEDRALLDDPGAGVLDKGGIILVANLKNARSKATRVLGCCALLREADDSVLQLAKMAVDERFLGKRIGHLIGQAAIARARAEGMRQLRLETNSLLTPAIRLYEKLGFVPMPPRPSAYTRADVQMVIGL